MHAHQLATLSRYPQNGPTLSCDRFTQTDGNHRSTPAMKLPLRRGSPAVYLPVPAIGIVTPELQCCPTYQAQETTSSSRQAPCLCEHPFPHVSTQTFLSSISPGCVQSQRPFVASEQPVPKRRHPLNPPACLQFCIFSTPGH